MRRHEELRRTISAYCSACYASEENPIVCDATIGQSNAVGLSELEMPQVTKVFHDCDAVVWVGIHGVDEPVELDELSTDDLETILESLKS